MRSACLEVIDDVRVDPARVAETSHGKAHRGAHPRRHGSSGSQDPTFFFVSGPVVALALLRTVVARATAPTSLQWCIIGAGVVLAAKAVRGCCCCCSRHW